MANKFDYAAFMAKPTHPEERTIETITGEILDAQRKGGEAILTIGRCLIEAKEMLPHGEWLPWLAEKVGYSEKTAQNFMRLAREFSNPQALADLGVTKALKLLVLSKEEREQFTADHNVIDMTTRQLEQAIRERDEARKAAEEAKAEASTAEQARAKMAEDMALLNARLAGAREDHERALQDVGKLEKELAELKDRPVEVAVETVVDQERPRNGSRRPRPRPRRPRTPWNWLRSSFRMPSGPGKMRCWPLTRTWPPSRCCSSRPRSRPTKCGASS